MQMMSLCHDCAEELERALGADGAGAWFCQHHCTAAVACAAGGELVGFVVTGPFPTPAEARSWIDGERLRLRLAAWSAAGRPQ